MTQPNENTKEHLKKRGIDPATLDDEVIKKFNLFLKHELDKADDLGAALMADPSLDDSKRISAVH